MAGRRETTVAVFAQKASEGEHTANGQEEYGKEKECTGFRLGSRHQICHCQAQVAPPWYKTRLMRGRLGLPAQTLTTYRTHTISGVLAASIQVPRMRPSVADGACLE